MAEIPAKREATEPDDLPAGTRLGRYRIESVVGRGGMGTVYRAYDAETSRDVAVKVLPEGIHDARRDRFLVECEAEARIRHPHVMPVYDRGRFGDRLFFVMELVYEPITLTEIVEHAERGTLAGRWPRIRHWATVERLVEDVLVPVCEGIDAANRQYGLLHRDLKPDNVLVDVRTRRPYVIDFGICAPIDRPPQEPRVVGTPRFLPPEQARGKADPRTDVWGLGALLHYVIARRPPLPASLPYTREALRQRIAALEAAERDARAQGRIEKATLAAQRLAELTAPGVRAVEDVVHDAREGRYLPLPEGVPPAPRAILRKAMAVDPEARYAHGAALAEDLRAWTSGRRVQALAEQSPTGAALAIARRHGRLGLWLLGGLLVGLVLGAFALASRGTASNEAEALADLAEDMTLLESDADALAAGGLEPLEAALRWRSLHARRLALAERTARDEAPGENLSPRLAALEKRMPLPRLRLEGPRTLAFSMLDVIKDVASHPPATPLPGPWRLRVAAKAVLDVPVWVPAEVGPRGTTRPPSDVHVVVRLPAEVGEGMRYVPPGPAAAGEAALPAFLVASREVRNHEYAEYLDDLRPAERAERVPPGGVFAEDPATGRWLVSREWEDAAVTGLRPSDATAYAAWRSRATDLPLRLPTAAEWRRAAGGGLLEGPQRVFLERRLGSHGLDAYGTRGLHAPPAEIVRTSEGYALVGIPPAADLEAALSSSEPLSESDRREDAGFRLLQEIR